MKWALQGLKCYANTLGEKLDIKSIKFSLVDYKLKYVYSRINVNLTNKLTLCQKNY